VLRPIEAALTITTEDAIAPSLSELDGPFRTALRAAEERANDILDECVAPMVVKLDLQLRGRELKSPADIDALLDELRDRLKAQLADNSFIRLL